MKKYILLIAATLGLWGCSSDYLNTIPESSTSPETLFATTKNAKMAINGLAKLMIRQYDGQSYNGEGTIKLLLGEYPSNDYFRNLIGWSLVMNLKGLPNSSDARSHYAWYYYYKLIDNANTAIIEIDRAIGSQQERDFIKAQALTYRAYSYMMLVQIFGNRWSDSNNGTTEAVVLRIEPGSDGLPLSTLAKVYTQIYTDLDKAIGLFNSSGLKRTHFYEPDVNVAQAIYARAAITKEDYANAAKYAKLARKGYPLMTNSEYKSGFNQANREWIWGSYNAPDENLYYYSFHSQIGYNAGTNTVRSYPSSISKRLYTQIPETDIRKDMYLDPGPDFILDNNSITLNSKKHANIIAKYRAKYPDIDQNAILQPYMQFKVGVAGQPGIGQLNHFRSAEMYLIEAEALHKLKKDSEAQAILVELNAERNPSYTCTKTGDDLFAEIKKYRAIELFAEGFGFFDLKRWGDRRVRGSLNAKDPADRDVFIVGLDITIEPDEYLKWTAATPRGETDYSDVFK